MSIDLEEARTRLNADVRDKGLGNINNELWIEILAELPPRKFEDRWGDEEDAMDDFLAHARVIARWEMRKQQREQAVVAHRTRRVVRPKRRGDEDDVSTPSWWWSEQELVMRRFSGLQDEMLELFDLKQGSERRFLELEEISDFVEEVGSHEAPVGRPRFLWVPLRRDPPEVMQYRIKVVCDGFEGWLDYWERGYAPKDVGPVEDQRLFQLAQAATTLGKAIGCLKEEATAFLLANDTPLFWPLTVDVDSGGGIVVHVRHRHVSLRDVTRAVVAVQDDAFGGFGLAAKPRHGQATVVFEFVELWREETGSIDWPGCFGAFGRVRGDGPHYKKLHDFQQAYYAEIDRRERARREAEEIGTKLSEGPGRPPYGIP